MLMVVGTGLWDKLQGKRIGLDSETMKTDHQVLLLVTIPMVKATFSKQVNKSKEQSFTPVG